MLLFRKPKQLDSADMVQQTLSYMHHNDAKISARLGNQASFKQSTTSSNFSGVISDCSTLAVDHSEIPWQLQLRSEKIIGPIHNSGLAEILAAQMALQLLRNWNGYKNEPVILRTDFLPLVQAMNGGVCDRFYEEIEKVRNLAMLYPNGVRFEHVYAHDGDPEIRQHLMGGEQDREVDGEAVEKEDHEAPPGVNCSSFFEDFVSAFKAQHSAL
ncbi:unnamed protein product [Angiostrongylus costaricensis]|uniref:RNase H domain-containing protein n=1 Tax=Angiostrongylus costaricensis TaxID=334426 RepID=A0A0R3PZE7_ANGCS|nr:unnamed protein product [Angiostrongylus costaricensis]